MKINYTQLILGVTLNILMIITSILIYNAYVLKPKIDRDYQGININNADMAVPFPENLN